MANWAEAHRRFYHMTLSIEKKSRRHCGWEPTKLHVYTLCDLPMASVDKIVDIDFTLKCR